MPIYGVEAYIGRAIESVIQQTFTDWELLIVNDGSLDRSRDIAAEYADLDQRIHIIDKSNGGLSSARLKGFEYAIGEYISFIDSDDTIEPTYLKELYANIKKYDADICICSYKTINEEYVTTNPLCFSQKITIIEGKDCIFQYYLLLQLPSIQRNKDFLPSFMWLRLFKKDVISKDLFISERDVLQEDLAFSARIYKRLNRVVAIDKPLYNYYVNKGSLTLKYRENVWNMLKALLGEVKDAIYGYPSELTEDRVMGQKMTAIQFSLINASRLDYKNFKNEFKNILADNLVKEVAESVSIRGIKRGFIVVLIALKLHWPSLLYKYNKKRIR